MSANDATTAAATIHAGAPETGSSGEIGRAPPRPTVRTISVAATRSNSTTTLIVEAIVGTLDPPTRIRTSAIFAASPPLAGSTALSATPTAYADTTAVVATRSEGYAALSTFRQATERSR